MMKGEFAVVEYLGWDSTYSEIIPVERIRPMNKKWVNTHDRNKSNNYSLLNLTGGRRSPVVVCWASDHWVASSNPLRGKFRH